MLDPIFDLLAGLLSWFYSLVPSYGFAIIALTALVLIVLSPLTYRSTKSMVAMRRLQPQVKRLQKKHKGDRETLNQEMMALYQEHSVSPLSGCLPILVQSPVFIVMFRVIRGITRRESTIGFDAGRVSGAAAEALEAGRQGFDAPAVDIARRNFNPEYLNPTSDLYQDLVEENEMLWWGVDLSRTPFEVITDSVVDGFPYIVMVAVVAVLGWYQQRQIAGRSSGEISSQQQLIMKIMPWMLPIFAFTMPAGLVLYFIVSSLLRVIQQAYLTRAVYGDEELNAPIEFDDDDEDDDDDDDDEPDNPLAALFGGGASRKPEAKSSGTRHGSRRPVSAPIKGAKPQRSRPAASKPSATKSSKNGSSASGGSEAGKKNGKKTKKGAAAPSEKLSGWGRAKRSAVKNDAPAKPVSKRVTPKGDAGRSKKK